MPIKLVDKFKLMKELFVDKFGQNS